jgi:hypothetical protein
MFEESLSFTLFHCFILRFDTDASLRILITFKPVISTAFSVLGQASGQRNSYSFFSNVIERAGLRGSQSESRVHTRS